MIRFAFWPDWYIEDQQRDLLGQGSFGRVFRIRRKDMGLETVSALKIIQVPANAEEAASLLDSGMDEASVREYYRRIVLGISSEIATMVSLKSAPNIITIEDYHVEEEKVGYTIYIRMQLLESLEQRIRNRVPQGGSLDAKEVLQLGTDISSALAFCESKNIIHRDIKPANIFVDEYGKYVLGDFGLSRQLADLQNSMHSMKGTPRYAAPEVWRGGSYDHTVDIYSLGIMLYRYLNHNRFPFEPAWTQMLTPQDVTAAMQRRLRGEPLPLPDGTSQAVGLVLCRACAPDPQARYARAAEFRDALQQAFSMREEQEGTVGIFRSRPEQRRQQAAAAPAAPAADVRDASSIGSASRINRGLRKVSFGFCAHSAEGPEASCWIALHGDGAECESLGFVPAAEVEQGGLRRILERVERERGISITECGVIGIPDEAGIRSRLLAEHLCRNAGLGTPWRILRTPSIAMYGYTDEVLRKQAQTAERIKVLLIRVSGGGIAWSMAEYDPSAGGTGQAFTEMFFTCRKETGHGDSMAALQEQLRDFAKTRFDGNLLPGEEPQVVLCCELSAVREACAVIRGSIPVRDIFCRKEDALIAAGAGCVSDMVRSGTRNLLLDITVPGYQIRRKGDGSALVEIPPQTTIPVRKEALVSAKEAYGSRLEILENGQSAGILSARPEMAPDTRKVRLALEVDVSGNVTWSRESVGEAAGTPSGGTPAASGAAARTDGNAAAGPAAKAAFRAMPAREVRKLLADASACREKGDYKGEQRILLQAANGAPDDPDVLIRLGRCYADNGQPRTAIGLYEKVQFLKPDYPTAYSNAGAAYFRLGEVDRAIPLYRRAIAMIEKGPSASNRAENGVTYANAAMVFSKRKHDPKEIRALLTKAEQCGYDTKNLRKLLKI